MHVLIVFSFSAGLNPSMNVSSMDMTGGLSVKDPSQSQSRLPQWTHPNPMDNLPGAASPLDQNPSKHGTSRPDAWAQSPALCPRPSGCVASRSSLLRTQH